MRHQLFIGAAIVALAIPAAASAQETTSTIRGQVTSNGVPVAGAEVTVIHVPSGSRSTASSSADGNFDATGLRVGGPFTVEVTSAEGNTSVTDIYTNIGQPYDLSIEVGTASDIVVTAGSLSGSGTRSNGPQTILTAEDVSRVASVNRDIRDLARRDPFATINLSNNNTRSVGFAGVNPRFNRFSVNGVAVSDNFGLNQDASPTRRGPVPFDAIDQFSVSIAPNDVRQGNFQGGAIDVVLRSGTNTVEGTGFYSINSSDLTGRRIGSRPPIIGNFKSETYGGRLSGPIIKDKLFLMVSAERTTQALPFTTGVAGEGFGTDIRNLTRTQINSVISAATSAPYNLSTGIVGDVLRNAPEVDEKIVARLDWNITDGQKLALTYINSYDSLVVVAPGTNSNTPAIGLASNNYRQEELLRTGVAQLNSDWTDTFSTEARASYRSYERPRNPLLGNSISSVTVCLDPSQTVNGLGGANTTTNSVCTTNVPRVVFGPESNSQVNQFYTDNYSGSVLAKLSLNNHDFRVFAEYNQTHIFNIFLPSNNGNYTFDSLADFQAGNASALTLRRPISGNTADIAADFVNRTYTFGVQDDVQLTDTLKFSYGARYDLYDTNDRVPLNSFFTARNTFSNTETIKGRSLFQPRFAASWKPIDRLSIRASGGIYGGGAPDVYIANSYSNTGVLDNTINITRNGAGFNAGTPTNVGVAALNNVNLSQISPTVLQYLQTNTAALSAAGTNELDPNFKPPSVWRGTLSVDYKANLGPLGDGWNFGINYLYGKVRDAVNYRDLRSVPNTVQATLPDGRPRYQGDPRTPGSNNSDILLTNSNYGRSHIGVVRVEKSWDFGLTLNGSYTLQDVQDDSPATSSVGFSNYSQAATYDPNQAGGRGRSSDETRWQFKYGAGFNRAFFGDYRTIIQLFGETRAGRNFSYTMQDLTPNRSAVFGTQGRNDKFLLYVPQTGSDAIVSYDSAATQASLEALIARTPLSKFRGQVAPRNIDRSRKITRIDLHLEQELPTFVGKSRISVFADIENLPNLLNRNWGGQREVLFPQLEDVVRVQCLTTAVPTGTAPTAAQQVTSPGQACAQYRYSGFVAPDDSLPTNPATNSLYFIRLGARLTF